MRNVLLVKSDSGASKGDNITVKGTTSLLVFKIHFLCLFIIGKLHLV